MSKAERDRLESFARGVGGTEPPPDGPHKIETTVKVYLQWGARGWEVDPVTMDGHPLDIPRWGEPRCHVNHAASTVELNLPCSELMDKLKLDARAPTGLELIGLLAGGLAAADLIDTIAVLAGLLARKL